MGGVRSAREHDRDGNGRQDRGEVALAGVKFELLNDAGDVLPSTSTDTYGRYSFRQMAETGDYQVRVVVPPLLQVTPNSSRSFLISRGDVTLSGLDFGLRLADRSAAGSFYEELEQVRRLLRG